MQIISRHRLITAAVALVAAWGLLWGPAIADSAAPAPSPVTVLADSGDEDDTPWD
jgi:hypothetical protein